ncbi:hypothetical protein AU377_10175 [Sporosarcina sp. HYO08]|nr:hypothetical protein AU377_10175 [Sporosarcina sp. HYO08]
MVKNFEEYLGSLADIDESKTIEGTFLLKNGKMIERSELFNHCHVCLEKLHYHDEYDSLYCKVCDEWREESCSDPTCEYCLGRPEKPSKCEE